MNSTILTYSHAAHITTTISRLQPHMWNVVSLEGSTLHVELLSPLRRLNASTSNVEDSSLSLPHSGSVTHSSCHCRPVQGRGSVCLRGIDHHRLRVFFELAHATSPSRYSQHASGRVAPLVVLRALVTLITIVALCALWHIGHIKISCLLLTISSACSHIHSKDTNYMFVCAAFLPVRICLLAGAIW